VASHPARLPSCGVVHHIRNTHWHRKEPDTNLILAAQLTAAKLNIANGVDGTPVTSTIADADAVLATYAPYQAAIQRQDEYN